MTRPARSTVTAPASAPAGTDTAPASQSAADTRPPQVIDHEAIRKSLADAFGPYDRFGAVPSVILDTVSDADAAHLVAIANPGDRRQALAAIVGESLRQIGLNRGEVLSLRLAVGALGQMSADAMKTARAGVTADDRKQGAMHTHRITQRRALADLPTALPAVVGTLTFIVAAAQAFGDARSRKVTAKNNRAVGDILDALTGTAPKGAAAIDHVCAD